MTKQSSRHFNANQHAELDTAYRAVGPFHQSSVNFADSQLGDIVIGRWPMIPGE